MTVLFNFFTCLFCLHIGFSPGSFTPPSNKFSDHPKAISKVSRTDDQGRSVITTTILLDATTSREGLIEACQALATEEVQLTFSRLTIRKSGFGLIGKSRISYAKGVIELPNGKRESFEAGGPFNFKSIRITYSQIVETDEYVINMVEIID